VLEGMQLTISERWGFSPFVLASEPGPWSGSSPLHDGPVAASGRDHRARGWQRIGAMSRSFTTNFPGAREIPLLPAAIRGRQLQIIVEGTWYINRPVRHRRGGAEDHHPGRQCRASSSSIRAPRHRRRLGRAVSPWRARAQRQPRRLEGSTAPRQICLQTPMPARSRSSPTVNFILKWVRGRSRRDEARPRTCPKSR